MKKLASLSIIALLFATACKKDQSNQSQTPFSGVKSTADLKVPANFNWKTTQTVSVDISHLQGSDAKQTIKIVDARGSLLLNRQMKVRNGDKLVIQLPISDNSATLIHNGIEENIKISNGNGAVLTKKGGGKGKGNKNQNRKGNKGNGNSGSGGYPANAPCPCDGRMENVTFLYSGPSGQTLTVWYKSQGNSKSLSHTFSNLTTGDVISVNGFTTSGNSGNTPRLKSQTFLSLGTTCQNYWNVHTSCSEYILGNNYGPFKVIAFTDGQGRTCATQCVDSDNDGCCDDEDAFPNDPTKCDIQYIPGQNTYGSYAFEDLWPYTGDFDFNDKVIDRTTALFIDKNGDVVEAEHKFVLRAAGAGYSNGFGFAMPNTTPGHVSSVTSSYTNPGNYTLSDSKGLEMGQSKAVVILYENWSSIAQYTSNGAYLNTQKNNGGVGYCDTITVNVVFSVPQLVANVLEIDPFLIRNGNRDVEIHLPWFGPTDLADASYFHTAQDASAYPQAGNNYVTSNNIPWAIETPLSAFEWPLEKADINSVYYNFATWAMTGLPANWYSDGNRDASKIY